MKVSSDFIVAGAGRMLLELGRYCWSWEDVAGAGRMLLELGGCCWSWEEVGTTL